jgi:hypothetical protein
MKKTTKMLATVIAGAAQTALVALLSTSSAMAQCPEYTCDPPGTLKCCPGSSATNFIAQGGQVNITATTNGCFIINSCTMPAGCPGGTGWSVDMTLQNFTGDANDPTLGMVHWRNDPTRPAGGSRITAYADSPGLFPAHGTIHFYAEAEIDGVPGIYRSQQEVVLENNQVMSWSPFVNEVFSTAPGVQINFINDVSGDVLTLTALSSTLN